MSMVEMGSTYNSLNVTELFATQDLCVYVSICAKIHALMQAQNKYNVGNPVNYKLTTMVCFPPMPPEDIHVRASCQ